MKKTYKEKRKKKKKEISKRKTHMFFCKETSKCRSNNSRETGKGVHKSIEGTCDGKGNKKVLLRGKEKEKSADDYDDDDWWWW